MDNIYSLILSLFSLFILFVINYSYRILYIKIDCFILKKIDLICLLGERRYNPMKIAHNYWLFHISRYDKKILKLIYFHEGFHYVRSLDLSLKCKKILTITI